MSRSTKSRIAACLNPPTVTELDASEGLPPWIILDTRVYLAHRDNSTTAEAVTSKGHPFKVSICFADPPALSYVCIHCPGLQPSNFADEPRVLQSEKQFLLLHLPLNWDTRWVEQSNEYYLYEATPQKPPTLSRIPNPGPSLLLPRDIGIYCCNNGEYILAGLCPTLAAGYELHLYSSVSKVWTRKPAYLEKPPLEDQRPVASNKVIQLGGSLLGWVDLWRGIMVCDVLSDDYVQLFFVPFPGLMPGNKADHICPWMIRDITCTNGSLKLIEIEQFPVPTVEESMAASLPDKTCDDSSFLKPSNDLGMDRHKLVGWRSIIWKRVLSDSGWRRECVVHVDDVLVVNPNHSALLAELGDNIVGNSPIMNLLPSFPTLSINGDDVVHMNSFVRLDTNKAHMISIDMSNRTLKTLAPCPAAELDDYCPHFPCVLSNHLTNTAAPQRIVQENNTEKVNAAVQQIVPPSNSEGLTENQHLRSCAEEVIYVPNRAQDALPQIVQASPCINMIDNQLPSSYAREVIVAPNRAQYGGSNLTSQQIFGSWHANCTLPGCGNYQRSLPLQQQLTYLPNWLHLPSWFSSGPERGASPVNAHPAYPVVNTDAFGRMLSPLPLNDCRLFQPPSQAPVLSTPNTLSTPPAMAVCSVLGRRDRRTRRNSPYQRISSVNEGFY